MIRQTTAAHGELSIILPGSWAWIPLADDEAMRSRIRSLVKQQVGKADRLATRRRQSIDELMLTATRARDAGAVSFALALELAPGIPFPASLIMTKVPWPAEGDGDPRARLTNAFAGTEMLEQRTGPVARRADYFDQRIGEDTTAPTLFVEYWLPIPHGTELMYIAISAPMIPDATLFTELFDSVVDSVTWSAGPLPIENES